jgi:transcriptional regulator with XRE-family HTH domain
MIIIDERKKTLFDELKEKEYREAYVSSIVDVGVAFQIRALRDQKHWSQTELAEKAKMQQERISVLENPSHSPTLATLKKLAAAFDVGLIVRFAPFSEVVEQETNTSTESLEVRSFDEEECFKEIPLIEVGSDILKHYYSKDATPNQTKEAANQNEIPPKEKASGIFADLILYPNQKPQGGLVLQGHIPLQNRMEMGNEAIVSQSC